MNVQLFLSAFEAEKKIEIIKTPFFVKTKPKIDISFDSKNAEPHNTPTHITYHRDPDVGSIFIYWHTLVGIGVGNGSFTLKNHPFGFFLYFDCLKTI